jgi:cytochrome c
MSRKKFLSACAGALLLSGGAVLGAEQQFGTPEEGKALLERAVAALKTDPVAALKQFNDEKNKQFREHDLYVFCFSLPDGNFTAFQSPVMLGTDIRELRLQDEPLGQHAYDAVANAPEGTFVSFNYNFPKPGTKKPSNKESLEARVGNQACGVTYFK